MNMPVRNRAEYTSFERGVIFSVFLQLLSPTFLRERELGRKRNSRSLMQKVNDISTVTDLLPHFGPPLYDNSDRWNKLV